MQASVKEGRGSVPLCASHRRGAIAPSSDSGSSEMS